MQRRSLAPLLWTVAVLGAAMAVAALDQGTIWPVRLGVSVELAALVFGFAARGRASLLLSPLSLLGAAVLVAYSLLPALLAWSGPPLLDPPLAPEHIKRTAAFAGSPAEGLILAFAALCLAAEAVVELVAPPGAQSRTPLSSSGLTLLLAGAVVVAAWMWTTPQLAGTLGTVLSPVLAENIVTLARPLGALALAALAVGNAGGAGRIWVVPAAAVILMAGASAAAASKLMLVGAVGALGHMILAAPARHAWSRAVWLAAGLAIGTAAVVGIFFLEVSPTFPRTLQGAVNGLITKTVYRQSDTGYCLDRVVERRLDQADGSPLYFTSVLIPRALWPDKPVISRGDFYSDEYCPFGDRKRDAARGAHSASITLLGEPVEQAGRAGLAVAMAVVLVIGAAVSAGGRRSAAGRVMMLASLPWMVDFDQQLSLYVGNLVKAWLVMVPVVAVTAMLAKRRGLAGDGKGR